MRMLTAIIRREALNKVVSKLAEKNITRMTVTECHGIGGLERTSEVYRGEQYTSNYRLKARLDVALTTDEFVQTAMDAIKEVCHNGHPTDGVIFISELTHAENIGSGKSGPEAL